MNIDLEYIKKWTKISEQELMERLVKDAVGLQKDAQEKERKAWIAERMQDETYNIEYVREFFVSYGYLSHYFSDEEILLACKHHASKSDMVRQVTIRGHRDTASLGLRFVKYTRTEFTETSRNGWSRTVVDDGTVVLMPSQYQSWFAGKIVQELLYKKLPYLKAVSYTHLTLPTKA